MQYEHGGNAKVKLTVWPNNYWQNCSNVKMQALYQSHIVVIVASNKKIYFYTSTHYQRTKDIYFTQETAGQFH